MVPVAPVGIVAPVVPVGTKALAPAAIRAAIAPNAHPSKRAKSSPIRNGKRFAVRLAITARGFRRSMQNF